MCVYRYVCIYILYNRRFGTLVKMTELETWDGDSTREGLPAPADEVCPTSTIFWTVRGSWKSIARSSGPNSFIPVTSGNSIFHLQ